MNNLVVSNNDNLNRVCKLFSNINFAIKNQKSLYTVYINEKKIFI